MTSKQLRPWYVSDRACDDYVAALGEGGDLEMLKALKILRSILVNIGIIALGIYSIRVGADPTVIGLAFGVSAFGLFLLFFNESGM